MESERMQEETWRVNGCRRGGRVERMQEKAWRVERMQERRENRKDAGEAGE